MPDFILLMGHGSRCCLGAAEFLDLVDAVRDAAPDLPIETGFLEFGGPMVPTIQEAIDRCVARGARRVLAVPVLLFYAGHGKRDMPGQIALGRQRHPGLDLVLCEALGIDRTLLAIAEDRIAARLDALPPVLSEETAVLLVARGTTDGDANSDFFKVGRLLWERNRFGWVECGFISLAQPSVPAGIARCVALGARRVLVVPYFLDTGVLVQRIAEQAIASRDRHPGVDVQVASHMGLDQRLVDLVLARARQPAADRSGHNLAGKTWRYQPAATTAHSHAHDHGHVHGHGPEHGHSHAHDGASTAFRHDHRIRIVLPTEISDQQGREPHPIASPASNPAPAPVGKGTGGVGPSLVSRYALPPTEIEALSLQRVAGEIPFDPDWSQQERAVISRMVYAAGDPSLASLIRIQPSAVAAGVEALRAGRLVVVDVRMVAVALDQHRLEHCGSELACAIDAPGAAVAARRSGLPRALEGIRLLHDRLDGSVVVIGNAPTALLALLDLVDAGEVQPALIIGTPVGFVAAVESKAALAARAVPFITVDGPRGGSAIAAAAFNAVLRIAVPHHEEQRHTHATPALEPDHRRASSSAPDRATGPGARQG